MPPSPRVQLCDNPNHSMLVPCTVRVATYDQEDVRPATATTIHFWCGDCLLYLLALYKDTARLHPDDAPVLSLVPVKHKETS